METFEARVLRDPICSAPTLKKVRTLLEQVVEEGTARSIREGYYRNRRQNRYRPEDCKRTVHQAVLYILRRLLSGRCPEVQLHRGNRPSQGYSAVRQ